ENRLAEVIASIPNTSESVIVSVLGSGLLTLKQHNKIRPLYSVCSGIMTIGGKQVHGISVSNIKNILSRINNLPGALDVQWCESSAGIDDRVIADFRKQFSSRKF
ncbi:MAG: hypothetical protein ACRCX2_03330, partial [Paraclostridium sp.]